MLTFSCVFVALLALFGGVFGRSAPITTLPPTSILPCIFDRPTCYPGTVLVESNNGPCPEFECVRVSSPSPSPSSPSPSPSSPSPSPSSPSPTPFKTCPPVMMPACRFGDYVKQEYDYQDCEYWTCTSNPSSPVTTLPPTPNLPCLFDRPTCYPGTVLVESNYGPCPEFQCVPVSSPSPSPTTPLMCPVFTMPDCSTGYFTVTQ
ncbi:proline-rich receptor-like protein kinase PERK2 [Aplysia californica]|uniref:Proline-rich receptor-like protein kinase PERK2 n=1 Tax=Aplysia californica TaxID=6500 RepID=A0ABM0JCW5_APLCA|nr:proline-rich receptor-like protein kinase PERK2 [Aplysia californica]